MRWLSPQLWFAPCQNPVEQSHTKPNPMYVTSVCESLLVHETFPHRASSEQEDLILLATTAHYFICLHQTSFFNTCGFQPQVSPMLLGASTHQWGFGNSLWGPSPVSKPIHRLWIGNQLFKGNTPWNPSPRPGLCKPPLTFGIHLQIVPLASLVKKLIWILFYHTVLRRQHWVSLKPAQCVLAPS